MNRGYNPLPHLMLLLAFLLFGTILFVTSDLWLQYFYDLFRLSAGSWSLF